MTARTLRGAALFAAAAALVGFSIHDAGAIPAFARKYQYSCSTCHAPFPRLKPFGAEFAARGFRLEDPSAEPTRATIDTGDPLLQLMREVPLALRFDAWTSSKEDEPARWDIESPWVFKALSGGPVTNRLAYYAYFIIEKNEVVGLEDAWLQYNKLFGLPVDVVVGQFQVCDPLFKRELRLERNDYEIFRVRPGHSVTNLTYDRGVIAAWGAPADIDVVLQVTNGNGIDPPEEGDNFDVDERKNVSLRLAREFGPVRLGAFGYSGREELPGGPRNRTSYIGPDFVAMLGDKLEISLEYLRREDDDPYFVGPGATDIVTKGGFAEVQWFPRGQDGRWTLSALYNKVSSDDEAAEFENGSVTLNWLLARNARLSLEGERDLRRDATRVSAGIVAAF
ncbi:MAG: hypothetical protein KBD01_16925 [Acidobacteria bacterium]|nr:hypothetical protein [Acidobacteriota bacterium]